MASQELDSSEAHRKAEWLAYQKHLAEMEELRALEQACEHAAQEVFVMRAQLIDAQLDRQRAELAWQVIGLARQSELLDSFRAQLRTIVRDVADPLRIIRQIREKVMGTPCEAIDWTTFDIEFHLTYPEFQSKLIVVNPEFTGTEIRVCTLLKLKLTSADIGTLLCISERSLQGHRLHIRRKMGLAQGEDIDKVLAGI
jgi:hypothetical protein